eukprot:254126_1
MLVMNNFQFITIQYQIVVMVFMHMHSIVFMFQIIFTNVYYWAILVKGISDKKIVIRDNVFINNPLSVTGGTNVYSLIADVNCNCAGNDYQIINNQFINNVRIGSSYYGIITFYYGSNYTIENNT